MNLELDLKVARPEFVLRVKTRLGAATTGIFGASGSGKSTLLAAIAGLVPEVSGRIALDGDLLLDTRAGLCVPPQRRRIGFAFQDDRLFPHLTVENNLSFGMRLLRPSQRKLTLDQVADLLEISHLRMRPVGSLSGGQRKRVALGRALLASPRLLLLDEPLSGLDPSLCGQILPFLRRVRNECGIPILIVSHQLSEILELTERILVLREGRMLACDDFFNLTRDPEVLPQLHQLGLLNLLHLTVVRHEREAGMTHCRPAGGWVMPDPEFHQEATLHLPLQDRRVGEELRVVLPADGIALGRRPVPDLSIRNQVPGRVVHISKTQGVGYVQLDMGTQVVAELTLRAIADLDLKPGGLVWCFFKTNGLRVID